MKYGITIACKFCGNSFITKPRYVVYCSAACKNPINRPGNQAWNKGITLSAEQKARQNTEGLKKGHGWNKGLPNEAQRKRWLDNNPNKDGAINNARPKKLINNELEVYKSLVRKETYRTIKAMRKAGEFVPKCGKHKTDLQVDHVVPYKQGYELGIPAEVLGSRKNIQFLKGEDNRAKWDSYQPMHIIRFLKGGYYGLQ